MIKNPILYKVFKDLGYFKDYLGFQRLTGQQFLAVELSPTFLNTGATDETFQQSGKQDSFRHLFKSKTSI